MPQHEYTGKEALDLLLDRLKKGSPELDERVRKAIDAGKESWYEESETLANTRSRKVRNQWKRKVVPFTDEESIQVALGVLESHLVESRIFVISAHSEFTKAAMSDSDAESSLNLPEQTYNTWGKGKKKRIEVEEESQTVLVKLDVPNHVLEPKTYDELESLKSAFRALRELLLFSEEADGYTK